ncbi:MAG: glycosyltransferase family 4 protein [Acidobacteria bacterium]|nr:glycosyltransferase family 4 protein [Acidobacteriota bacterium]
MRVAIDIRRAGDFGIGTYTRNVIHELARQDRGSQYLLIGSPKHFEEMGKLPENFELLPFDAETGSFRTHFHLPLILNEQRVDLLHMPWFYAPALVPCPLVITVHDLTELFLVGRDPKVVQAGRRFFARRAMVKASRILAVSQAAALDLIRAFGVTESKVTVIHNALDERFVTEPYPVAEEARILERHAVTGPFVLYAGNIRPHKNLTRLIEAFAVAKGELQGHPELSQLKLLVIGDELAKHADLRRAVVRARVREDVRFLGFVPHQVLRVFYARARAFLFPSLYEGFGLPPLEAMAHGTPVVTSNVSSLPEVCGDAALQVNPEKVFDIAKGIVQALTDEALRRHLIERGKVRVQQFSWSRATEQIRSVYASVARKR